LSKFNNSGFNARKILNLSNNFSISQLKKAYHKLALKTHPDKGGDPNIFEIITKAYLYLVEEIKIKTKNGKTNASNTSNASNGPNGFITNYIPLISDLDKATIEVNGVLILSKIDNNSIILQLAKQKKKFSKVFELRHDCNRNPVICNKFKPYHYEIIILLFDMYILFYTHIFKKIKISVKDHYNYLKILNTFVKQTLHINDNEFVKFYESIHNSYLLKITSEAKLSFHINAMIYNFCNNLI